MLNIPTTFYKAVKASHYDHLLNGFRRQQNVDKSNVHLIPNIVSPLFTIEERAAQMATKIKQTSQKINADKAHLVTYSFGGVDARAALSLYGLNEHVQSLTTLCTPHHGLRLIDQVRRFPDRYQLARSEQALEVLGLGPTSVTEFTSENIRDFNEVCEDCPDVDYYSFGAKKQELAMNETLRAGYEIITDYRVEWECDGLVEVSESRWGQYLLTFDHDHFEVVGFNPKIKPQHVANLITDNLRVNEISKEEGGFE